MTNTSGSVADARTADALAGQAPGIDGRCPRVNGVLAPGQVRDQREPDPPGAGWSERASG